MKIVFLSNFFNHHQKPFSDELSSLEDVEYTFIATEKMPEERVNLGYPELKADYVLNSFESGESMKKAMALINEADAVIYGSAPFKMLRERIAANKLVIAYSERLFKKSEHPIVVFLKGIKYGCRFKSVKNAYLLCAGGFVARDYARIGLFKGKTYRWAYFPEIVVHDDPKRMIDEKKRNSIVWVGRFIDWKHPEIAVLLAERLKSDGLDFEINMIGNGAYLEKMSGMISEKGLSQNVHLLGSMDPKEVRQAMDGSEILLFTSDRQEGYGVVLPEAISSLCVPVADSAIGSVPFLIDDQKMGITYQTGDMGGLYSIVKGLLLDDGRKKEIALSLYNNMLSEWTPHEAAVRMRQFITDIINDGHSDTYSSGPCSRTT